MGKRGKMRFIVPFLLHSFNLRNLAIVDFDDGEGLGHAPLVPGGQHAALDSEQSGPLLRRGLQHRRRPQEQLAGASECHGPMVLKKL